MTIKAKIGGAIATAAMLAATMMPVAAHAATTVTIGPGNGVGSVNGVAVIKGSKSVVKQGNLTVVNTTVGTTTNTGLNKSSFNTGGSNSITTGGSTTTSTVAVAGGSNTNTAASCCCDGEGGNSVNISGNGAFSFNGALVVDVCKNVVKQGNATVVNTTVISNTNTGGNSASFNTNGTQSITTGGASTTSTVAVTGSTNTNN